MPVTQVTVEVKGVEIDVEVEFTPGWFQRGCRSGHPDNWTPDEGEAAEVHSVALLLGSGRMIDFTNNSDVMRQVQKACDEHEVEPDFDDDPYDHDSFDDSRDFNVDCGTDSMGRGIDY